MEVSREHPNFSEAGGCPAEDFGKLLESQKVLFDDQVDRLRHIVVTQCRLTGVNPLSQEMAAGALTIKIGKRPRDLLNPRAVKYMEDIFSFKDAISKKEFREISALFGLTVTQVRDFFASQRMQVRKFCRLSRERVSRSAAVKNPSDDVPTTSQSLVSSNPVPLNSIAPTGSEEESNSTAQENKFPGLDESDKRFVDNIFKLMSKEETFSGQLKLLDWIGQIRNPSVLSWFLATGGIMIVATWVSQAASEEQIDVLCGFLEVLGNLPINNVPRSHVAPIIQEVNRLRFYHVSDVSNRAQTLLTKWSKTLLSTQGMAKINGVKVSGKQNQGILKSSSGQILSTEPWHSDVGLPEELLASSHDSPVLESSRKLEGPALKLLPASADDPNRKHILGSSSSQNRKRRKVQLVEHPGQKLASNRSPQPSKVVTVSQSRPMSADDIQKAKMRAFHMQNKYQKGGLTNNEKNDVKTEVTTDTPQTLSLPSPPGGQERASVNEQDNVAPPEGASKISQVQPEVCEQDNGVPSKSISEFEVSVSKSKSSNSLVNHKTLQIPWTIPTEIRFSEEWRVGGGEESKEVDVQRNRNKREKETLYNSVQEIPLNPKEPWDREMDYDDTLTPVIPIEQQPDADEVDPQSASSNGNGVGSTSAPSTQGDNPIEVEPDYELLAVLLQTPSLVFTLKEELEGRSMSQQTVRILDMIRAGEINIQGDLNGNVASSRRERETMPVSLPSPTPSSDRVPGRTGGSVADAARNPFSRQRFPAEVSGYPTQGVATTGLAAAQPGPRGSSVPAPAQVPADTVMLQQLSANMQALAQLMQEGLVSSSSGLPYNTPNIVSEQVQHQYIGHSPNNGLLSNSSISQRPPELIQQPPTRNPSTPASSYYSLPTAAVDAAEKRNTAYPSLDYVQPQCLRQAQQSSLQQQPFYAPGSALSTRREGFGSHRQETHLQVNQTSYDPYSAGNGMVQPQWRTSANPLDRGGHHVRGQFDSWSPENSPTSRNPEYRQASRSALETRPGPDRLYAGQERPRHQASSGYHYPYGDYSGQVSKWQQDRGY